MAILLSLDVGSTNNAYSVYDTVTKQVLEVQDVTADNTNYPNVENKISYAHHTLSEVFKKYGVSICIYEQFVGKGSTAAAIYQVLGGIKLAATNNNVQLLSYTAPQVKRLVTGNGKADKADIAKVVNTAFNLNLPYSKKSQTHKTDSLGVLYCYLRDKELL